MTSFVGRFWHIVFQTPCRSYNTREATVWLACAQTQSTKSYLFHPHINLYSCWGPCSVHSQYLHQILQWYKLLGSSVTMFAWILHQSLRLSCFSWYLHLSGLFFLFCLWVFFCCFLFNRLCANGKRATFKCFYEKVPHQQMCLSHATLFEGGQWWKRKEKSLSYSMKWLHHVYTESMAQRPWKSHRV